MSVGGGLGPVYLEREQPNYSIRHEQLALLDGDGTIPRHRPPIGDPELHTGTVFYELYDTARQEAASLPPVERHVLDVVHNQVAGFIRREGLLDGIDYASYSWPAISRKWGRVTEYLQQAFPEVVRGIDIETTQLFKSAVFSMYSESQQLGPDEVHPDADATFAFVVPARMSSQHPEYASEVESTIPLMKYIPAKMRAQMLCGLPPFVIDRYLEGGAMVFAPVYEDAAIAAKKDAPRNVLREFVRLDTRDPKHRADETTLEKSVRLLSDAVRSIKSPHGSHASEEGNRSSFKDRYVQRLKRSKQAIQSAQLEEAQGKVDDAVRFASRRMGAAVVGLGAVLPGITRFGRSLTHDETLETTTGHAGTVWLIEQTLRKAQEEKVGKAADMRTIGVLGCGSIGASIGTILAQRYREDPKDILVYDSNSSRSARLMRNLGALGLSSGVRVADDVWQVLTHSDVVVSAITTQLDLQKMAQEREDVDKLDGLVYIDDSMPGSMQRAQAERFGINLAWVIGTAKDGIAESVLTRRTFNYGDMGEPEQVNVFGCEAEAAAIAQYRTDLLNSGIPPAVVRMIISNTALRSPVTVEAVARIGDLFSHYGIKPSKQLQSFGMPVTERQPTHKRRRLVAAQS